jgi:tetratricopeptide (TPR) repeat protein
MAIRTDVRGEDDNLLNPYTTAYFAYVNLILTSSFGRDLPLWFSRGLAGVLSNTIVEGNQILLGPVIPWHLRRLQTDPRLKLKDLISVTRSSREYTQGDGLARFDAQAWALVQWLMFGQNAARREQVNKFAALMKTGKDFDPAFVEAFGQVAALENDFAAYINRQLFVFQKFTLDRRVTREQFTARALPPGESAAGRAAFHVAMGRPNEARTLIDEARKAEPDSANTYLAEALLMQRENKRDEANAAFVKAANLGSMNATAHYRAAMSMWVNTRPDAPTLRQMETYLARATELNPGFAAAYAALAEVRASLGKPEDDIVNLLTKAVTLDPSDAWIRIAAARALWRLQKTPEARKLAEIALSLAADDQAATSEAQRLLAALPK